MFQNWVFLLWTAATSVFSHTLSPLNGAENYDTSGPLLSYPASTNGFRYEVRFPHKSRAPLNQTNPQVQSQLEKDNIIMESRQIIKTLKMENYKNPESTSQQELDSHEPSKSNVVPRKWQPTQIEHHLKTDSNNFEVSHNENAPKLQVGTPPYIDRTAFLHEETLLHGGMKLLDNISPNEPDRGGDGVVDFSSELLQPETYSSVQFTGSVFTEEGLPVVGSEAVSSVHNY